jgi:hypothetical protein
VGRLTDEQRRYGGAMELIIELYHQLKEISTKSLKLGRNPKAWLNNDLIEKMAKLFHLTIPRFSPCLFIAEYSIFRFWGEEDEIRITNGSVLNLVAAIDALKEDRSKGVTKCFEIKEHIVKFHQQTAGGGTGVTARRRNRGRPIRDNKVEIVIVPAVSAVKAMSDQMRDYRDKLHRHLSKTPANLDCFNLGLNDSKLFDTITENYALCEPDGREFCIFSPGYGGKSLSVFEAAAYLLIRYQWLFGSFERVKLCKQCSKLFVEKRLGSREFCGGTCRKRYHDSLQSPEKIKCRNRQNQWIRYKAHEISKYYNSIQAYRLQKDDCHGCADITIGGKCPALIKKNPKAYKYLSKHEK